MRLLYGGWGAGLLDGGTKSRVYWEGRVVYMGVHYANLSFAAFRTMILGIHYIPCTKFRAPLPFHGCIITSSILKRQM